MYNYWRCKPVNRYTSLTSVILLICLTISAINPTVAYGLQIPGSSPGTALQVTSGKYSVDFNANPTPNWFKIDAQAGQTISVLLTVPSSALLNLYLYSPETDSSGSVGLVASSTSLSGGGNRSVVYIAEKPGTYYIKVEGAKFSTNLSTYELKVFVTDFTITSTYWGDASSKLAVASGDVSVPLTVTMSNNANYTTTGLTASLILTPPFSSELNSSTVTASSSDSAVAPSRTASFTFNLNVDSHANIGNYILNMMLDYYVDTGDGLTHAIPVKIQLNIPLLGKPNIVVQTSQYELVAGATNNVTLTFNNLGSGVASNFAATLTLPTGVVSLTSDNQINALSMTAGESLSKPLTLDVSENAAANIQINIAISYRDAYGLTQTINRVVGFKVLPPDKEALEITASNTVLTSGSMNNITLSISNQGTNAVSNLQISFTLPTGTALAGSSNQVSIQSIAGGSSVQIPISLYIPPAQTTTVMQLQTSISYQTSQGSAQTFSSTVGFQILPHKGQVIDLAANPSTLTPGISNNVTFTIRNLGSSPINDLNIELTPPTGTILIGGSNFLYLKSLNGNTAANTSVTLYIDPSLGSKIIQVATSISYNDIQGSAWSLSRTVGFNVLPYENSVIDITADSSKLIPGVINSVTLSIKNLGSSPISDLNIQLSTPTGTTLVGDSNFIQIKSLEGGGVAKSSLHLYLEPATQPKVIQIPASISFHDMHGSAQSSNIVIGFNTLVGSQGLLSISQDKDWVIADTPTDLGILVTNGRSQPIYNLTISASAPSPIAILSGGSQIHLGDLQNNVSAPFNIRLLVPKGISSSTVQLQLSLTYFDGQQGSQTQSQTISLGVRDYVSPLTVVANSSSLASGYTNKPTITIKNTGDSPLSSVEVTISPGTGSTSALSIASGTDDWVFESIKPHAETTVTPLVSTSLNSADTLQELTLTLTYIDSSGSWHKETKNIGYIVKGTIIPTFQDAQASPSRISIGGNFTVTGNILNIGTADALFANVSLDIGSEFRSTTGSSQYVGDIASNTPIPFSVAVTANRNLRNGTYPVTVLLTYQDDYGQTYVKATSVQVSISNAVQQITLQTTNDTPTGFETFRLIFFIALAAIIAVGGFLGLRAYRGRRQT
jgi:hypothetical protein